jgi:hypothetical protein
MKGWNLLFIMGCFGGASAQAQTVGVGASYVFVDELDDVYGVVGHVQVPMSEQLFVALRGALYQDVERSTSVGPIGIDITADYVPVDLGLGWAAPLGEGNWTFYAEGGVSYVFVESDIELNGFPTDVEIEDDLGWYATAGIRLGTGAWQGFAEAQFRTFKWSVDEGTLPPATPAPEEIDLDHIALNIGVVYQW